MRSELADLLQQESVSKVCMDLFVGEIESPNVFEDMVKVMEHALGKEGANLAE